MMIFEYSVYRIRIENAKRGEKRYTYYCWMRGYFTRKRLEHPNCISQEATVKSQGQAGRLAGLN